MLSILKKGAVVVAMLTALVACKTTEEAMVESGATKMDAADVTAALSDTTREWSSGKGASYHAPDGRYVWKMNSGGAGEGTWTVKEDGSFCFVVPEWGASERCFAMYMEDGQIVSVDSGGTKRTLADAEQGNTL